jgi:hypothetical protein
MVVDWEDVCTFRSSSCALGVLNLMMDGREPDGSGLIYLRGGLRETPMATVNVFMTFVEESREVRGFSSAFEAG